MKICITSEGKTLDSKVDQRFGRCRYFLLIDTATSEIELIENIHIQFASGAGVQSGQFLASKGVEAVITGNVGPSAYATLTVPGIKIYTGVSGFVKEALEDFKAGKLKATESPSVGKKSGIS